MLDSIFFWEALTFVVLMSALFVFYPAIRRRKRRVREAMEGQEGRYEEPGVSREEYLIIKEDMKKTTEEENVR